MSPIQRWEHKVISFTGGWISGGDWDDGAMRGCSTETMLNRMGAEGWEFVAIGPVHNNDGRPRAAYIFRRPLA